LSAPDPQSGSRPGGVFGFLCQRPVAVMMAFITLLAFGWQSLQRLPMSLLPDISYPTVTVRASYPGAAPEDVEERVTKRLHETLSILPRLESISSISRAGLADVTLEFSWGTQLTYAIQDIRERLDRTNLPLEVETPIILRYDPTLDPILVIGLTGGRDLIELRRLAEDRLSPAISTIEGVAAVHVRGGLEDEIQVRLLPERLSTWGLRPADIASRLSLENVNLASGTVLEGDTQYLVRILNEYGSPEEIARTILFREGDSVVRLSDVAEVTRTTRERDVITRIDAKDSVELQIFKEADANIVDLATRVRDGVFGDETMRAWVAGLRSGEIPDPDEAMTAFRSRVTANPVLQASMQRILVARDLEESMEGAPGDPGSADEDAPEPEDTRTSEEIDLDDTLSEELDELNLLARERESAFDYLAADLPADVSVHLLSDQSRFIASALAEVNEAGLEGALLSILVLFLFLRRLGPTLIIALSIPVSVIVSFAPLFLSGTSLNVMSLGGLALGIGMLVDNAIVVLESIEGCRERGQSRLDAAVNGVREVAMAVTASTLTTVAVFAPIVFVEGIAGQVFKDQALTVVVSLMASLLVALYLAPVLQARGSGTSGHVLDLRSTLHGLRASLLRAPLAVALWQGRPQRRLLLPLVVLGVLLQVVIDLVGRVLLAALALAAGVLAGAIWLAVKAFLLVMALPTRAFGAVYGRLERAYPICIRALVCSPSGRAITLALSVALFAWSLLAVSSLGSELLPEVHQGELIARLALPVGTPLEATSAVATLAEDTLIALPDVEWVSAVVGVPRDEISQPDEGEHTARISIGLHRSSDTEASEERVMAALREKLADLPEVRDMRFERPTLFSIRSPIVVEIKGDNLARLASSAQQVEAAMQTIPGLRDVRSSVQPGSPEVMLSFDRDLLSRRGLDTRAVASAVAGMVQGTVATRFTDEEHKLDVLVQVDKQGLRSLEDLMQLPANPGGEGNEPLSALSTSEVREGPREIRRIWGQRAAIVSASLSGFDIGRASAEITKRIADIERRGDLSISMGGQGREMGGALTQMTQAMLLAVFLVYVVMASMFESLLQPLMILITVPLAMTGAIAALWLGDIPLSVVVFIGGIILAGIVVNNAIVLIDAINRRRRHEGQALVDAVTDACHSRLRPILMTTMTTVLGLLPLTGWLPMTSGEGMELRSPMAITVVAGLSVATLLTLVVIPVLYTGVEGALERLAARRPAAVADTPPAAGS